MIQDIKTIFLLAVITSSLMFLPFSSISGRGWITIVQLPVLIAELIFIYAAIREDGSREFFSPIKKYQRILLVSLGVYVASVSTLSHAPTAKILALSWLIHVLFFLALLSYFRDSYSRRFDMILSAFAWTALIHVSVFLFSWAVWPDEIRQHALPAFDNIRHLGYYLAPVAAVIALGFVTRRENAPFRLLCYGAATLYILYTGSRGGAVALFIGMVMTFTYLIWNRLQVFNLRVLILLGFTGVLIFISEALPALPWPPVFSRGADAIDMTGTQILGGRSEVWNYVALAIKENWLLGYGPALMSYIPEYRGPSYLQPHNIGLQMLLHWGILGTLLILSTASSFVPNLNTALRHHSNVAVFPFALISTMGAHALVDGGLFYPFSVVIAIIAFAFLVSIGASLGSPSQTDYEDATYRPC